MCWISRGVTDGTPGDHRIRLGSASRLGAGVYWIRLTQGDEWRAVRGVVVK
jgi:hypothetical protein